MDVIVGKVTHDVHVEGAARYAERRARNGPPNAVSAAQGFESLDHGREGTNDVTHRLLAARLGAYTRSEIGPVVQLNPTKLQFELVYICRALVAQGTAGEPDHVVAQATRDRRPSLRSSPAKELDLDGGRARIRVVHGRRIPERPLAGSA